MIAQGGKRRLPSGLTRRQSFALEKLARAIAEHLRTCDDLGCQFCVRKPTT
jgi:hypothetical protein